MDNRHSWYSGCFRFFVAKAVELANLITASAGRPVNWIHMPVPIDRSDAAYFAPIKNLNRAANMELYLGLVHAKDVWTVLCDE